MYHTVHWLTTGPDDAGILAISNGFGSGNDPAEDRIDRIRRMPSNGLLPRDRILHRCGAAATVLRAWVHIRA